MDLVSILITFGLIALITSSVVFVIAMVLHNNSIMDIAYGPIYLIATTGTSIFFESYSLAVSLITLLVALWSTRLSLRILHKNSGKPEDPRYAAWRNTWQKRGKVYFVLRSYLQVFVLQSVIITIVALPLILLIAAPERTSLPFLVAGVLVWVVGFCIETIADWQLDQFIAGKKAGTESAVLMTTGLFRYSRRPNYFGETLLWWGLALIALPVPFGWLGLLSPVVITYIVTQVTGPMLEELFAEKYPTEFAAYKARTSYFIPRPPTPDA